VKYKVAPQSYEPARGVLLVQRRVLTLPPAKSHHKIVDPNDLPAPEWRNWQTRQLEGLVRIYAGAGSSPVSGNFSFNSFPCLNDSTRSHRPSIDTRTVTRYPFTCVVRLTSYLVCNWL
jgi:hypothetical protein